MIAFLVIEIGSFVRGTSSLSEFSQMEEKSVIASSSFVHLLTASSSGLIYFFGWGGLRCDPMGVISYGAQWPEWITGIVFLVYITAAVECKDKLSKHDVFRLIAAALSAGSGWFVSFLPRSDVWLCVSCYVLGVCFLSYAIMTYPSVKARSFQIAERVEIQEIFSSRAQLRKSLTIPLLISGFGPVFIYGLAIAQVLSYDWTLTLFAVSGSFAQLFFIQILRDLLIHNLTNEERLKQAELKEMSDRRFNYSSHSFEIFQ